MVHNGEEEKKSEVTCEENGRIGRKPED